MSTYALPEPDSVTKWMVLKPLKLGGKQCRSHGFLFVKLALIKSTLGWVSIWYRIMFNFIV